jgi:phosphatidylglycerol lysyltransferase
MKGKIFKILFGLFILAAVVVYFYYNLPTILETFNTTYEHLTGILGLAIFVGLSAYIFVTYTNILIFNRLLGLKRGFKEMLRLQLLSLTTNVLIPSGGFSGAMVYADDAKDRGESRAKATIGGVVYVLIEYSSICIILTLLIAYHLLAGVFGGYVLLPAIFFFSLTGFIYWFMFVASSRASFARKILVKILKFGNKIIKKLIKKSLDIDKIAQKVLNEIARTVAILKKDPKHMIQAIGVNLTNHFLKLFSLFLVFYSLGITLKPQVIIAGYAIGVLVTVFSPTPNGVGFVEGAMVLVYSTWGVPASVATTATIIYRGFEFWMPFFGGLYLLQKSRIKKIRAEILEESVKDQ